MQQVIFLCYENGFLDKIMNSQSNMMQNSGFRGKNVCEDHHKSLRIFEQLRNYFFGQFFEILSSQIKYLLGSCEFVIGLFQTNFIWPRSIVFGFNSCRYFVFKKFLKSLCNDEQLRIKKKLSKLIQSEFSCSNDDK